ncbi:MAG: hypothetical protein JST64_08485 [Actinobacteria bacterium]|nr:hypothetical protein [Actinomycetota bacterium]
MADLHPNLVKAQDTWDAVARGELGDTDDFADDIVVENGPGAGPWRLVEGKDTFFEFVLTFIPYFDGSWHQDGTCIYADDRCTISLVRETGSAPDGDAFDNLAIWISRIRPDGTTDRIWTVDLDQEHCEAFWERHAHELPG